MIHYHGGPITPVEACYYAWKRGHALVSWQYRQCIEEAVNNAKSFAADNSAFTKWKHGEPSPNWQEYAEWVADISRYPSFDQALIPDVIDGTEAQNNELVEWWMSLDVAKFGTPVWHMHEDLGRLRLLVTTFPTMAIGSSGDWPDPGTDSWWGRMSEAMEVACDDDGFPLAKLWGLRMLDPFIFSRLPLKYADSTNIARNVGMDVKHTGSGASKTHAGRAFSIKENIEMHASATRWINTDGIQRGLALWG